MWIPLHSGPLSASPLHCCRGALADTANCGRYTKRLLFHRKPAAYPICCYPPALRTRRRRHLCVRRCLHPPIPDKSGAEQTGNEQKKKPTEFAAEEGRGNTRPTMLAPQSLRKAAVPPALLSDPTPGSLQPTRLAVHVRTHARTRAAVPPLFCFASTGRILNPKPSAPALLIWPFSSVSPLLRSMAPAPPAPPTSPPAAASTRSRFTSPFRCAFCFVEPYCIVNHAPANGGSIGQSLIRVFGGGFCNLMTTWNVCCGASC